jgi:hypothetical protein
MQAIRIDFTDFWHPDTTDAKRENFLYRLLSRRFDIELSPHPEFLIYSCFGRRFRAHRCLRIFYTGENVRPNFDECDYAFSFDYPLTARNYRLPLWALQQEVGGLLVPRDADAVLRSKSRFCNFLFSNPRAKERIRFFKMLSRYKRVDAGGGVLNNIGYSVPPQDTVGFLSQYKFTIAFENSSYPGYTTEKLVRALRAQTIPIYWGNPAVHRDFNTRAFINCHEYPDFGAVVRRVIEVDNDDDLFREYVSEPPFAGSWRDPDREIAKALDRFATIFADRTRRPVAMDWRRRCRAELRYASTVMGRQVVSTVAHLSRPARRLYGRLRDTMSVLP